MSLPESSKTIDVINLPLEKTNNIEGIVFLAEKQHTELRMNIEIGKLKEEISTAKEMEQEILDYFQLSNYLGININKNKHLSALEVTYPITIDGFERQSKLYVNIFSLYFLKNPDINENMILNWVNEGKRVKIDFGADNKKKEYYIEKIEIIDASGK